MEQECEKLGDLYAEDRAGSKVKTNVLICTWILCWVCASGNPGGPAFRGYNPCCSMPCQHKGVCTPVSSTQYECCCPKGYYGKSCEQTTFLKWLRDKMGLDEIRKKKLVSSGKLMWGLVNNIPLLHDAALRYLFFGGSDSEDFNGRIRHCNLYYPDFDFYRNHTFFVSDMPPVPRECPTPLGVKGPRTLPDVHEMFELLFRRKGFKPCPLGTNLLFATFAQYLAHVMFDPSTPDVLASAALRQGVDGKLRTRIINGEEYPPYLEDVPEALTFYPSKGDGKTVFPKWAMAHKMFSETPMMFALATIWLREHNRVCDILLKEHPYWNDEKIYQTAKRILLGELLTITGGEYFQHLTQYRLRLGYKPQLFNNRHFSTLNRMRYEFNLIVQAHLVMPDVLIVHGKYYNMSDLSFGNNRIVFEHGLDAIVDSMSRNPTGKITFRNCGEAFKTSTKQLIQEGRKIRLQSLNDYRRFYGLKPYKSFFELTEDEEIAEILEKLYGDIDAVEFIVGLFIENHPKAVIPPTLFFLAGSVLFQEVFNNPLGSSSSWRPSTFGGKIGFDIIQKVTLRKLFCLNMRGNCKNNVWVSFRTPTSAIIKS